MQISPTGIKISFGGRRGVGDEDRPVVARIIGFTAGTNSETISREMIVPAGQTVDQNLPKGLYNVQLTLPSGRILQRNVEIDEHSNETYEFFEDFAPGIGFSLQESSGHSERQLIQESSWASGNASQAGFEPDQGGNRGRGILADLVGNIFGLRKSAADRARETKARPYAAKVQIGSGLSFGPNASVQESSPWKDAQPVEVRGSVGIWRVEAKSPENLKTSTRKWARIELADGGVEIASLPLPWYCTGSEVFAPAEILVDPERQGGASTTVAVRDAKLSGLLAYLDRGQAGAARPLLEQIESENLIERTIEDKMSNPLAACAAAYVGLSAYPPNEREEWDRWLQNCMMKFPDVPDAAIVHARRLILRPDVSANVTATEALKRAIKAGPPFFSAGVALLREMLLQLSADQPELMPLADRAAELAARADPTQIFTVLRFAPVTSETP
jgi:hypothetical protein